MSSKVIRRWVNPYDSGPNATGWHFFCPGCEGVHGVNDTWGFDGDEAAPSFTPSILVTGGSRGIRCHSFVERGRIRFLGDSTHPLAGKTVPIPPWPYGEDDE